VSFKKSELALVGTAAALVFSRVFGLSLVLPNFRDHFESEFAVAAVLIGLAFGAHGLTMALMQLPMGILSDKVGRKPILLIGSLFFIGGSVLAAFADNIWILVAARLLQGMGAISSVAMAAVGETIPAERRATAMALIGIPAGAGFLFGMGIGPALYPLISMSGLFLVTAGIGALALIPVMLARFGDVLPAEESSKGLSKPVLALGLAGFTSSYFLTTTLFFLPTSDWKVLLPMMLVTFIFIGVIGRIVDKKGATWQPISIGLVLLAISAPLFVFAGTPWLYITGGLFFIAHSTLQTTVPGQVSRFAGRSGGRGHGVQNVIAYFGTFVAGPIAGVLTAQSGIAFVITGALGAGAALFVAVAVGKGS
jgi:predicted MFS family arabinose efflux permease